MPDLLISAARVVEVPWAPDNQMWWGSDTVGGVEKLTIFVGTQPPSDPIKVVGREARLLVRRGLADVLQWLNLPVINEPVMAAVREVAASTSVDFDL